MRDDAAAKAQGSHTNARVFVFRSVSEQEAAENDYGKCNRVRHVDLWLRRQGMLMFVRLGG